MRLTLKLAMLAMFGTPVLFAQTCGGDTSGNSMLKGSYRFRNVIPLSYNSTTYGISEVTAANGIITFNGAGGYTMTGTYVDNTVSSGKVQTFASTSSCYAISANGIGYIVNPVLLAVTSGSYVVYDFGAVSQGVFAGSMTEAGTLQFSDGSEFRGVDTFIAIPSGVPTSASFNTPYQAGVLDFTSGVSANIKNALFKLSPNGAGGLGSMTVTGESTLQNGGATLTQTSSGGTYSFASDGTATLNINAPSGVTAVNQLFSGAKTMYVSSNGAFVLGWTPNGYDVIFGVNALTQPATQSTLQGTYYTSALEWGSQPYCPGYTLADAYSGSILAFGAGSGIVHQRLWSAECLDSAYDYTEDDSLQFNADGTGSKVDYFGYQFSVGDGGAGFVGISGSTGFYSLVVGLQAPSFSGSGVYLNPLGVFNAASYAPATAPFAPGELITLFGTGLAPATLASIGGQPFPTNLGGVQVLINGTLAPIYRVSPTQVSVIVPYALATATTGLAQIQVNNSGLLSNTVTVYATDALPGIFTAGSDGIGYAIALHPDGSFVTQSNPAQAGEVLAIYLTGLGTVTPTITDGALGPSGTLSYADEYTAGYGMGGFVVYFNDYNNNAFDTATVNYAGLAPGLAGLYQMNVVVPADVGPGDVNLEVVTYTADVNQVQIPVGSGSGAAVPAFRAPRSSPGRRERVHGSRAPARDVGNSKIVPQ